jgi:Tfp pilus assembly protein PilE
MLSTLMLPTLWLWFGIESSPGLVLPSSDPDAFTLEQMIEQTIAAPPQAISADLDNSIPILIPEDGRSDDPILAELIGSWQWQEGDNAMTLVFGPSGRLVLLVEGAGVPPLAEEILYQVDSQARPMNLDLTLSDTETFETIFALGGPDQLYVELAQINPGQVRPEAFSPYVLIFQRLAVPSLPPDTPIQSYEDRVSQQREAQARAHLDALIQAQDAYHQKKDQYAEQWEAVVVGLEPETPFYQYALVPPANPVNLHHSIAITATAKVKGIRSYTGLVVSRDVAGEWQTFVKICATSQPALEPPQVPQIPAHLESAEDIVCTAPEPGSR